MQEKKAKKNFLRPAIQYFNEIWPVRKKVWPPLLYSLNQWFPTGVQQGGARGASSYYISKNIWAILTTRSAVKNLNNPVRVP